MRKTFIVEFRIFTTIANGLSYYKHCGERQLIVMHYLRQIFELSPIDALIFPSQMITGSNGRVFRVFLQKFVLHIINDGCGKEDAHRTLRTGQQV